MFHSLEKMRARARGRHNPRDRRAARPRVEQLEARDLPSVYTPAQIRAAYGFNQVSFGSVAGDGSGQTIAIVDAYADPNIAADLNTFDQTFSINGTQSLYQQYGSSSSFLSVATPQGQPAVNSGWALETALDVEWAHAIAPGAKILLVESASSSLTGLLSAVSYAAAQPGVSVVSMSWGTSEFASETAYDSYFQTPAGHQGVTFVASAGDTGAPPSYPAVSPNVLSVGGTSLSLDAAGNYLAETAWSSGGGGYSAYESRPTYQQGAQGTGVRSNPDVAYSADPNNGFYVYDSVSYSGYVGWFQVGGTSAGAPQWAALVAVANQGRALGGKGSLDGPTQTLPAIYSLPSGDFHDITSGSNGYAAGPGYDAATGRGSPLANLVIAGLVNYGSGTPSPPAGGGGGSSGSGSGGGGSTGSGGGGGWHRWHHWGGRGAWQFAALAAPTTLRPSEAPPAPAPETRTLVGQTPPSAGLPLPAPGLTTPGAAPLPVGTTGPGSTGQVGETESTPAAVDLPTAAVAPAGDASAPLAREGSRPSPVEAVAPPADSLTKESAALEVFFTEERQARPGIRRGEQLLAARLGERPGSASPALTIALGVVLAGYWQRPSPRREQQGLGAGTTCHTV